VLRSTESFFLLYPVQFVRNGIEHMRMKSIRFVHAASEPARSAQHCEIIDSLLAPMQGKEHKGQIYTSLC
jgi:hypothetical protein